MSELPKLKQLIDEGVLVLWHDYRQGTLADLSGNGNDGSFSNAWWGGGGAQFQDPDGYIVVADAAELQLTAGTFVVLGEFTQLERTTGQSRLISKRDAGGTNYEFRLSGTPTIEIFDGANIRSIAADYRGYKTISASFTNGATPEAYLNGLDIGAMNDVVAISTDDAPVFIGNLYQFTRSTYNIIQAALIFNIILDADEIAQVHGELVRAIP